MRILYLSAGSTPDYQCDALLHGLKSLYGAQVVDVEPAWFLYQKSFAARCPDPAQFYGRGFSLYGTLPELPVDRSDIPRKIQSRYFDLVIYGSIHRDQSHLWQVLEHYKPSEIVFVDGEDQDHMLQPLINRGITFKRELNASHPGVFPIHFAIPKEKVLTERPTKTKVMAHCDPRDRSTYIFETEPDYYQDYAESLFGVTTQKAGWDCMRHYEILANRCIPHFIDLVRAPALTMHRLPKIEILLAARSLGQQLSKHGPEAFLCGGSHAEVFWALEERIHRAFRSHCTTEALAHYVLATTAEIQQNTSMRTSSWLFEAGQKTGTSAA